MSYHILMQPPSGGCVLKLNSFIHYKIPFWQPPSGGCVLQHQMVLKNKARKQAAAFGRLCVETANRPSIVRSLIAAAFGRLCVETFDFNKQI